MMISNKNVPTKISPAKQSRANVSKTTKKSAKTVRKTIKARDVSKEIQDVMLTVTSPGLPSEVKFASAYTTGPTSIAQFQEPISVRFGTVAGYLDTPQSTVAFVFRDPVRNQIVYDANPDSLSSKYDLYFNVITGGQEAVTTAYTGRAGPMSVAYAKPNVASAFNGHGNLLGVGLANGNKTYIWSQLNTLWSIQQAGALVRVYQVYKWTPRGDIYIGSYNSGTIGTLAAMGYIRFEIYGLGSGTDQVMNPIGAGNEVSISFENTGPIFRHLSLINYDSKAPTVEKVRILSQGFLLTNTTPAIARGGKIAAKQFPGDEPWYEFALNGYDSVSGLVHADLRDASNGLYGFLLPTTLSDFEMTDNIDYNSVNSQLIKFAFDLDSVRAFLGYYAVLPAAEGQSAQFVSLTDIEFESDDQWYQQSVGLLEPKIFEEAVHSVATIPQFHENPTHVKDIMNSVKEFAKKVATAVEKYGPTAVEIGSLIAAML